jgi:serine/threonine protein kinase
MMTAFGEISAESSNDGVRIGVVAGLQPGDPHLIGPYRLVGELGSGGMGRVFLGLSAGGRPVAVKVIRAELAADREFRTRFAREVAAARRVSGFFTALVIDADVDGPVPWLATAYIAGPSLAEAVAGHGPLPPASVLALAAGLAEGLAAIHAADVVHRDLKPANVLLADDGPRVIDFGISRAVEATSLTDVGFVVGSPGFMSPEQAEGREVGPPSDMFSLGAILVFAAAGQGPFGTGSAAALVYRIVHASPDLDQLPAKLRPLVGRCLAKDPGERPTAGDLLAEIGVLQPAPGWLPEPVSRAFALADEQQVPAETDDPSSAVATHAPDMPQPGTPPPGTPQPDSRPRRLPKAPWVAGGLLVVAAAAVIPVALTMHDAPSRTPAPVITRTIAVSAKSGWQRTNIYLKGGQKFSLKYVSGGWTVDYRNFPYVGPGGYSSQEDARIYQHCKYNAGSDYGVLFGVVGTGGRAFRIGGGGNFVAAPGRGVNGGYLYLRINDTCLTDNAGSLTMRIRMP